MYGTLAQIELISIKRIEFKKIKLIPGSIRKKLIDTGIPGSIRKKLIDTRINSKKIN
jgi:hypothetical protein